MYQGCVCCLKEANEAAIIDCIARSVTKADRQVESSYDRLGDPARRLCPINGSRQVWRSRPFERTSWNRLARDGVFIHQTSSGGRPKESSCVNIRSSSFVEVCPG